MDQSHLRGPGRALSGYGPQSVDFRSRLGRSRIQRAWWLGSERLRVQRVIRLLELSTSHCLLGSETVDYVYLWSPTKEEQVDKGYDVTFIEERSSSA